MKRFTIFLFSIFCFSALAKAEYLEYYDFQTPLKMKKQTIDYQPASSLKPNTKKIVENPITPTVKTHYEVNTNSMPKGIYHNNFVYTNGPMGALRPTHVPNFDTQHVQF